MTANWESRWLQRYVNHELDAADRNWFEAYLLDKPDLLDGVEADTALREGLQELAVAGVFMVPPARTTGRSRNWRLIVAAALSVVLAAVCMRRANN